MIRQNLMQRSPAEPSCNAIEGARVAVIGANGFVGKRLVTQLLASDCRVIGVGLAARDLDASRDAAYQFSECDVSLDAASIAKVIDGCDFVFHLAAVTRSVRPSELVARNLRMTENVVAACQLVTPTPTLIYVSSITACGPSEPEIALTEIASCQPRSYYGKSKLACEEFLRSFAGVIPISIVRPPIVLGPGDSNGLKLFHSVDRWGVHLVSGLKNTDYSVIHVDDLARAMIEVALSGTRVSTFEPEQGVFFASSDETFSYSKLGELVGSALGRESVRVVHVPRVLVNVVGFVHDCISRMTGRPQFLSRDKMRDVLAGDWVCSNEKIKTQTEFRPAKPFYDRLVETAEWYRRVGWLKSKAK